MSREIIDELMGDIKSSSKEDFSELLAAVREYGFIDDLDLAELFKIDLGDLEEILDDSENLSKTNWNKYRTRLFNFLKKEKLKYQTLYYDHKKPTA
jgi:hypothetical protein